MMLALLEQDIPGITERVQRLGPDQQRFLARSAADLALRVSPVTDARVERASMEMGASGHEHASSQRLQELVDELDDDAAALQAALDAQREIGGPPERERELLGR